MKKNFALFLLTITFSLYLNAANITPITTAEYALFLNATAVPDDIHHCYDPRMASDPDTACIQYDENSTSPYSVINETKNDPAPYLSILDEMRYCNWRDHGSPMNVEETTCTEEGSYTLQDDPLTAINREGIYQLFNTETNMLFSDSDSLEDLSLKEKKCRYLIAIQGAFFTINDVLLQNRER